MITVEIRNLHQVSNYLSGLPDEVFPEAKAAFQSAVLRASNKTKHNATNILKVRSGHLRQSINQEVKGTSLDSLKASVFSASVAGGSEVKYAKVHEFGAGGAGDYPEIKAIDKYLGVPGGPYLNIPTDANKTAAGVTRYQASEVFNMGGHIRGRSVWLGDQMMFALVKKVSIPARLGMRDACEEEIPTLLSDLANLGAWD